MWSSRRCFAAARPDRTNSQAAYWWELHFSLFSVDSWASAMRSIFDDRSKNKQLSHMYFNNLFPGILDRSSIMSHADLYHVPHWMHKVSRCSAHCQMPPLDLSLLRNLRSCRLAALISRPCLTHALVSGPQYKTVSSIFGYSIQCSIELLHRSTDE